ncbi:MAG: SusD/RagB family nutrient-binding outer membrane lipoprotein, partial [Flavobacteriaceae bacterium]|nr:SusD/RagB family nutrient-binding outer membrane lipoprotein [Flavobacteriaceae bacterium]
YPAGGAYDDGVSNTNSNSSSNLGGAGIHPILTSSFTDFLLAEAALSSSGLSINGDARAYLESDMRKSFSRVETVAGVAMDADSIEDYIAEVLNNFDIAADDSVRLSVIIKEFYIASFGNSLEAYNFYRRTGFPNLGSSVVPNTDFPRNLLIPESELNTNENENVIQITRTDQVFWDTNPAGFIE